MWFVDANKYCLVVLGDLWIVIHRSVYIVSNKGMLFPRIGRSGANVVVHKG